MIVGHHGQTGQTTFGCFCLEDHRQLLAKYAHGEAPVWRGKCGTAAGIPIVCRFCASWGGGAPGCALAVSLEELKNNHANKGFRPNTTTASILLPLCHEESGFEESATFTLYKGSCAAMLAWEAVSLGPGVVGEICSTIAVCSLNRLQGLHRT